MKRIVVLNNPNIDKIATLNIDGDKTVVLEKSREGVQEYAQDTKDNVKFLDYTSQHCAIAIKEDNDKLPLKMTGIVEHSNNSFVFHLFILQNEGIQYLPVPDKKALEFVSGMLTGEIDEAWQIIK